ncbi:MBL fold metallo-hydrolase [Desulfitobacterium sp. PCE1]|uniref:MBL fold metallo-hydrolase n=1 Tax=Desulfitobacterium sp. PCE1 TaxID=146907 RepID=UPI0003686462|nr:MBL fold metallo-hydrolase [Desulfitobacterium sp. PCE1]
MRLIQFETVYQIAFMPRIFPVNCYLVEETDDLTLIDTGLNFCWKGILHAASAIGKPIARIALTHPHADHIGSLDKLKEQLPQAVVYISERDSSLMYGDFTLKKGEPKFPVRGGFKKNLQTRADLLVSDGDFIKSLRVISASGHTPGSIAFYDIRSRILIAGDALQTRGGLAVAGDTRILFPFPAVATWHKKSAVRSVERLNELNIQLLAVGHGKVLKTPGPQIERALQRIREKLR